MVTVREQLPGQLTELSEDATVEHAAEAQMGLASWLDRVRVIYEGAALQRLEKVAQLTLKKELETTVSLVTTPLPPESVWPIFWHIYMSMKTPCPRLCCTAVCAKALPH